jgi:AcrR family transcriptional regulator
MGRGDRRKRDQETLRDHILDAARALFAEFGYEAVTMRRIAERIEYSPTTIYLYFKDKEALVRELCSVDFLSLAAHFRAIQGTAEPIERIRAIGRAFMDFGLNHPNHYRMMFLTAHPPVPVDQRRVEKGSLMEDAWAILVAAVADAQKAGVLRRDWGPEDIAQLFFAGVHGVVSLHLNLADDPWIGWAPIAESNERMLEALIHGFSMPEAGTQSGQKRSRR